VTRIHTRAHAVRLGAADFGPRSKIRVLQHWFLVRLSPETLPVGFGSRSNQVRISRSGCKDMIHADFLSWFFLSILSFLIVC
jgi:hypothetical protein